MSGDIYENGDYPPSEAPTQLFGWKPMPVVLDPEWNGLPILVCRDVPDNNAASWVEIIRWMGAGVPPEAFDATHWCIIPKPPLSGVRKGDEDGR